MSLTKVKGSVLNPIPELTVGDGATRFASAVRDATVVARTMEGLTDAHAFADETIMDNVTDVGTYGAFDATTELKGSHTQAHVFAYQDRIKYSGSGTLIDTAGFYSNPSFTGSGNITNRSGVDIKDVTLTGGGTLSANIGVLIRDLSSGSNNVGLNILQTPGGSNDYAIYANGGAKCKIQGDLGLGIEPSAGIKAYIDGGEGVSAAAIRIEKVDGFSIISDNNGKSYFKGAFGIGEQQNTIGTPFSVAGAETGPICFMDSTTAIAYLGSTGDYPLQIVVNGGVRLEVRDSANGYAFRAGTNNTQSLGDAGKLWTTVYATNGTINTSDERKKQDIEPLDEREKMVARSLKGLIRKYRFKDSVVEKGDAARIHVGVIAQDVIAAFEKEGLDPMRYSMVCYDEWDAEYDADGVETVEAGNSYGIRYDELLAFIISVL